MPRSLLAHAEKLHALQLLVEAGSFRRAASALQITPSALSQSITALERHLGRALVIRGRTRATPTPYAEQVLAVVSPALSAILSVEAPAAPVMPPMKLRLGAYESIALYALPDLLARLAAKHPSVGVSIRTGRSGQLVQLVRRGELDAALVAENDLVGNLHVEVVGHDDLGLYATAEHAVLRGGVTRATPYAGLAPGVDGLPGYYGSALRAYGLSKSPFIACDSFEALRVIALRHVACAILPRRVAKASTGELRLVPRPAGARETSGRHGICLVSRKGMSGLLQQVLSAEMRALLGA